MRMTVAYDGSDFHGFARNVGVPTVAGTLGDALASVLGHSVDLVCAGRTDRGVHARAQVVSFDADASRADPVRLVRAPQPHVRSSHRGVPGRHRVAGLRRPALLHRPGLPLPAAQLAGARPADGRTVLARGAVARPRRHAHRGRPSAGHPRLQLVLPPQPVPPPTSRWSAPCGGRSGGSRATSPCSRSRPARFCHQMVRSLVALLVSVGLGRHKPSDVGSIIAVRDRAAAPSPGPSPRPGAVGRPLRLSQTRSLTRSASQPRLSRGRGVVSG